MEGDLRFQDCKDLEDLFRYATDNFPPHQLKSEILDLLIFLDKEKPKIVCEIGTGEGGTNFLLTHGLNSVEEIVGIDKEGKNFEKISSFSTKKKKIFLIQGSSAEIKVQKQLIQQLDGKQLDLLFIDGDHAYQGVKSDFEIYRQFVRRGGLVVFHDIVPDFRTRYGRQTERWVGDVPRYFKEIKKKYEFFEFVENPDQDGFGLGLVRYFP